MPVIYKIIKTRIKGKLMSHKTPKKPKTRSLFDKDYWLTILKEPTEQSLSKFNNAVKKFKKQKPNWQENYKL